MIKLITNLGTIAFIPSDKKEEYLERGYKAEKSKGKKPKGKKEDK